jgi:hypothetical protein
LLLGLISLLLLALCNLIATHAWVSLLLGLPFAIRVYKQGSEE